MTSAADINNIQEQIVEEFSMLDGDMEMSNVYIMELGNKLPVLAEEHHIDENLVKGCQSKVWLVADLKEGQVQFMGDSNTAITKGLLSMMIRLFSGRTPDEILESEITFVERIGMNRFIGTQRSNGLAAMIKQMKLYALAFKSKVGTS